MNVRMSSVDAIMSRVQERDPAQHEFHQAVQGVFDTIRPVLERNSNYRRLAVLERLLEPDGLFCSGYPGWMMAVKCG